LVFTDLQTGTVVVSGLKNLQTGTVVVSGLKNLQTGTVVVSGLKKGRETPFGESLGELKRY